MRIIASGMKRPVRVCRNPGRLRNRSSRGKPRSPAKAVPAKAKIKAKAVPAKAPAKKAAKKVAPKAKPKKAVAKPKKTK